jgi:Cu2+-containing amine oxidase
VKYDGDACGPYRDWQNQEGMINANGADPVPGFRLCNAPATTILDTGNDTGNFLGVGVYVKGQEAVLVSEMQAGWYRYISEWRFDANGTIRPRFGFGAIANTCTCQPHNHHAFWRFDFDVNGTNNSVYELPNKSAPSQTNFLHPTGLIATEKKLFRAGNLMHRYRIKGGDRSYVLVPGTNDGDADDYARGDMWFLHFKSGSTNVQNEYDDGSNPFGSTDTEANLDQFLNNESLVNQDSVIWYHASFYHTPDDSADAVARTNRPEVLSGDHVVGPDLFPENW